MKIGELIKRLKEVNSELEILFSTAYNEVLEIENVKLDEKEDGQVGVYLS